MITILLLAFLKPFSAHSSEELSIRTAANELRSNFIYGRSDEKIIKKDLNIQDNETPHPVRNDLGLDDYRAVAKVILEVQKSMTEDYEIGDGLTLVTYILKTFSEIGEYDLPGEDILAMIAIFEKLTSLPVPPAAMEVIQQIDYLRFARINGKKSVEVFTLKPEGIKLEVEASEEEGGGSLDIEYMLIQNRSKMIFTEMKTSQDHKEIIEFMNDSFKVPLLPTKWFKKFNQIEPGVTANINRYLKETREAPPLKLTLSGMIMRVDTQSVLGTINFNFEEAYTTPGLKGPGESGSVLPSFHLWMSGRSIKVKSSVAY